MSRNLIVDKNQRELKQYGTDEFPFRIGYEDVLDYQGYQCLCHWHDVFELIHVCSGKMYCQVNEKSYILEANDSLFINSNALHYVKAMEGSSCKFYAINFSHELLGNEQGLVYKKYIKQIMQAQKFGSFVFDKKIFYGKFNAID